MRDISTLKKPSLDRKRKAVLTAICSKIEQDQKQQRYYNFKRRPK